MSLSDYASFYINLDTSTARRAEIEAELQAAGIVDAQRISAFDGRGVDLSTLEDCDLAKAYRYLGRPLKGGEYGCYRSHLAMMDAFLQTDRRYGLVFEDDAAIDPKVMEVLDEVVALLEARGLAWDVVHISAGLLKIYSKIGDVGQGRELMKSHYFSMQTTGLLWSREGARHFTHNHRRIWMPIDTMLRYVETRRGRGFAVWRALVTPSGAISEIDGDGRQRKQRGRSWFYGLAKQKRLWSDKFVAVVGKLRFRA